MHYNYIKKHTELTLREVLGQDVKAEKERIENELYERGAPELYPGKKGLILKIDKNYEVNCSLLQQRGYTDPKHLSIREFYIAIDLIEKQSQHGKPKGNKKSK
jgi:hypothetical protein